MLGARLRHLSMQRVPRAPPMTSLVGFVAFGSVISILPYHRPPAWQDIAPQQRALITLAASK
jgi:hypothetical protein